MVADYTDYFDNRQSVKENQKITKYHPAGPILPIPMDKFGYFVNCQTMNRPTHKWRLALLETEVHVPQYGAASGGGKDEGERVNCGNALETRL
jgi:hypothetical protein